MNAQCPQTCCICKNPGCMFWEIIIRHCGQEHTVYVCLHCSMDEEISLPDFLAMVMEKEAADGPIYKKDRP